MPVQLKVLGSGRLGDSSSPPHQVNTLYPLYQVPATKGAVVKAMRFVNTHTSGVPFTLVQRSSSNPDDKPLIPRDAVLGSGLLLITDEELLLGPNDAIWAKVGKDGDANNASYADKIDFVLSGVERDIT